MIVEELLTTLGGDYLTDEKIIELFFARDENAINEIQKKYGGFCHTVASNILNLREDREPSLVCDTVEPYTVLNHADEKPQSKKVKHGLFLRVPSEECEQKLRARNLLSIFDGNTPAYFYYNDSKKYSSDVIHVDINDPLINELKRVLGAENVVFQ